MVSGGAGRWLGGMHRVLRAALTSLFSSKKLVPFIATCNQADLLTLKSLVERGAVTPPVDRVFPLAETPDAFRHLETGTAQGMIVVTVASGR
jgi:NADPH:quinone reductase-like Zn-dependent oxidoreductase